MTIPDPNFNNAAQVTAEHAPNVLRSSPTLHIALRLWAALLVFPWITGWAEGTVFIGGIMFLLLYSYSVYLLKQAFFWAGSNNYTGVLFFMGCCLGPFLEPLFPDTYNASIDTRLFYAFCMLLGPFLFVKFVQVYLIQRTEKGRRAFDAIMAVIYLMTCIVLFITYWLQLDWPMIWAIEREFSGITDIQDMAFGQ